VGRREVRDDGSPGVMWSDWTRGRARLCWSGFERTSGWKTFIGSDKSPLAEQAASEPLDLGRSVTAVAYSGQRSISHSPSFFWLAIYSQNIHSQYSKVLKSSSFYRFSIAII
jgi:hypothetical protein